MTIKIAGVSILLIGLFGLLSFNDFFLMLARLRKDYVPMAPDGGLMFVAYGIVLIAESYGSPSAQIRRILNWLTWLVALYGLFRISQHVLATLDISGTLTAIVPDQTTLPAVQRISPVTCGLFILAGLAYHFCHSGNRDVKRLRLANMVGIVIWTVGMVAIIGYLFGSPFLYSGHIIPMAATTSFCFMALGLGLVAMAGEESSIRKLFNGKTARGRLMRVVLPLVVSAILIQGLVIINLQRAGEMDMTIVSALLTLFFIMLTPMIIIRLTTLVFRNSERIEREKEETQELLLHEKARLKTLIDNLPDRIFFKDRAGRFVVANRSTAIHTGNKSPKEIVGRTDFDLYNRELAEQYFKDEQLLMSTGTPLVDHEEPSVNALGEAEWSMTSKIPIRNRTGQVVGLVGISRDVTEMKRIHEDLVAAKEAAEQASKLKDYFIANLSHEIRTPLNAIIGFSELLKEEVEGILPDISEQYFPIINNSSHRLMRTIDLMLNLSRLQSGLYETNVTRLNLDAIIQNLVDDYAMNARNKKLVLTYENTAGEALIYSDEYCISASIANLLDNALKYTFQGYVILKLYQDQESWWNLDVQDTGIGIRKEYRKNLFESFSQEDTSFTRPFEGIGLGLSTTKKMLDAIGAKIWVASTKEVGTTFTVAFPDQKQPG